MSDGTSANKVDEAKLDKLRGLIMQCMKVRAEVRFSGIVQGVHFRDYTRRFANQERVTGWVKNLPDGSVQACFEGEKHGIEEVVRRLREEHPRARIERVDVKWGECKDEFSKFWIKG